MAVLAQRLLLGDSIPSVLRLVRSPKVITAARLSGYLPPSVSNVPSSPPRPTDVSAEIEWLEYFERTLPVERDIRVTISSGAANLSQRIGDARFGGAAMRVAFDALVSDRLRVRTMSTLDEMKFTLSVNHAINAASVRMDAESAAVSDPGAGLTGDLHKAYSLVFTARRLLARLHYKHEYRDDGAAVMGMCSADGVYTYGRGLISVAYKGQLAVLSQNEWSQTIRTFAGWVVWAHTAALYDGINPELARAITRSLDIVRAAWAACGDLAAHILHKAHSRGMAQLNADSPCADLQDAENIAKWSRKYPDVYSKLLRSYTSYSGLIASNIDSFGPGQGLIPGAAYRILPEAPGDHLQAMSNYVTKAIDFADTTEQYAAAVTESLQELDSLAISAAAHRKDVPMPRLRTKAELEVACARDLTDDQYNAYIISARNRYLNLAKGQVLTRAQALAFDPTGCMRKVSWRANLLAHAKDRSMMPQNIRDYTDASSAIDFRVKNKLAFVAMRMGDERTVDEMVADGREEMRVATDVKPEMAKPSDAKRLFYESQPAPWVLLGETDESIGENLAPINGFMVGKSAADQLRMFSTFVEADEYTSWFFCTDVEGWSRNMGEPLNRQKADRYAVYLNDPDAAYVGEYYTNAAVYGRDKFGVYGPVTYACDFEGMSGKANTGYHLSIMKAAIGRLKAYLADELRVWAAPGRFMCLIDDGILRVSLRRKLTASESARAFAILAHEYERRHHRIDPTKAFYGHRLAVFLDKLAVDGEPIRNWTKVLGKITADVDDPLASIDMKISGIYATAEGMCDAGAPVWIAGTLAACMALHALEVFSGAKTVPSDGFSLCMPVEMGGYGGARFSSLCGVGLTDPTAEAYSLVRKLVATAPSDDNKAIAVARSCAISVWRAPVLARSNVTVLRNPGGISLAVAKLDVTLVSRATQSVMAAVVPWYDKEVHEGLMAQINAMDMSGVTNLAVAIGLERVTRLHAYDAMVTKIRKARFLVRLLKATERKKIRRVHKADITHVRQWFSSRCPAVDVTRRALLDYDDIAKYH